ncbi:hypothetical protein VTJ49DRAFT_4556 [Mycothermus thermophilus]|uniref:Extracellular membrane protein CFEM domain-containing protein n=1 Tax=Humicola insolens TaxID=85995 RepID=A0ABR3VLJ3_HUMIN
MHCGQAPDLMTDLGLQMLLGRMSLLRLGIWTTLFAAATAQTTNISSEILNFVPPCAQECFQSFISANFDSGICGNSPSFQCLCRQRGSSGYTLGEGAASCVSGEGQFGACRGEDGIESAKKTAYHMCVNVSNAQPQTHTAIAATLIQSETGPLLLPTSISTTTPTRTAQTPGLTTTTPTVTLPGGTSSTSITGLPAGFVPISPVTGTSTTRTLRPIATTSPDDAPDPPKFTSAQIAGIALGSAAALVFGILLILLARCLRKKKFRDLEANGFFKIRDSMSPGGKKKKKNREGSDNSPDVMEITAPLPKPKTSHDPLYPHWQPQIPAHAAVGLGLPPTAARGGVMVRPSPATASLSATASPTRPAKPTPRVKEITIPPAAAAVATAPTATAAQARPQESAPRNPPRVVISSPTEPQTTRTAGNSPPKPTLTLAIPKQQTALTRPPAPAVRDSVVTEFAEDGEGDPTSASTSVWRPPPSDPQSATTIYFADKSGNWILRNTSAPHRDAEPAGTASRRAAPGATPSRPAVQDVRSSPVELPSPEHKTRAERAREVYRGFSPDAVVSPLRLPRKPGQQGRLGSPIAFKDQRQQQRWEHAQYSSPSLASSTPEMVQRSGQANMKSPSADIYFAVSPEERDSRGGQKRSGGKRATPRFSQGSATSIEDAADDDAAQMDLSPVAESPNTPISPGKSPVTYPKIRKRNNDEQASGRNAGQGGDRYNVPRTRTVTPSVPQQQKQAGPRKPRDGAPNLRPQANRNPSEPRTGSPEMQAGQAPPLEAQYLQRQRQIGNPASYWNNQQPPPPQQRTQQQFPAQPPPPTPPYELPGEMPNLPTSGNRRYNTPPQQHHPYLQQHAPGRPAYLPTPADTPQSRIERPPAQPTSAQRPTTNESTSAAPTTISTPTTATSTTSSQGSLLAKRRGADKAAALALSNSATAGKSSGRSKKWKKEVVEEPDVVQEPPRRQGQQQGRDEFAARYGQVPITPGWVPELTPTRRGGDLYLNVR